MRVSLGVLLNKDSVNSSIAMGLNTTLFRAEYKNRKKYQGQGTVRRDNLDQEHDGPDRSIIIEVWNCSEIPS